MSGLKRASGSTPTLYGATSNETDDFKVSSSTSSDSLLDPLQSPDRADYGYGDTDPDPIRWKQLIPILIVRATDACTYAVIFPFITAMITSFDVPKNRIGLYAGMAEGSLMVAEALMAPLYARLADRYGRKPVVLGGHAVALVGALMVGFSTSVWQVVFWRGFCEYPRSFVHTHFPGYQ